jgi:hypothetical protein
MSTCVPASDLLFGRLSGIHLGELWQNPKIKVEAFSTAQVPALSTRKLFSSRNFLSRSLFLFDGKSWDFDGSEIIKRRNFDKSAHSVNFSPIVADNEQLQKKQCWKPTRSFSLRSVWFFGK